MGRRKPSGQWLDLNDLLAVVSEDGTQICGGFDRWADALQWAEANGYYNEDWQEDEAG